MNKFFRHSVYLILVIAAVLLQCNKYEFPKSPYPLIETLAVSNISETGATLVCNLEQLGAKPIVNHGFVWGAKKNVSLSNYRGIINLGSLSALGEFQKEIKSDLLKDSVYFVKAFISTDTYTMLGNEVSFESSGSAAPIISSFFPKEGTWGDTVTVRGKYFSSNPKRMLVKFGTFNSKVITSSDSIVKCIVPDNIGDESVKISVTVSGKTTQSINSYALIRPSISGFFPTTGTFNDVVTITGSGFSSVKEWNVVKFNQNLAEVIEANSTSLRVKVPALVKERENTISVTVRLKTEQAIAKFIILTPIISSISVSSALIGETIAIEGNNFNPITTENTVLFGDLKAEIKNATKTNLLVEIPNGIYRDRVLKIKVKVTDQEATATNFFTLKNSWIQKQALPADGMVGFLSNNKILLGLGLTFNTVNSEFLEYNSVNNSWSPAFVFPGSGRFLPFSFLIGDYFYVGSGFDGSTTFSDFWRYSLISKSWEEIAELPEEFSSRNGKYLSFTLNGRGYIIFGDDPSNFWEYAPSTGSWTKKSDIQWGAAGAVPLSSFILGNTLYLYFFDNSSSNLFYSYNQATDTWTSKTEINLDGTYNSASFSIGGFGYLVLGNGTVHKYDPALDSWKMLEETIVFTTGGSFVVNNKGYVWSPGFFWEFDPNYER